MSSSSEAIGHLKTASDLRYLVYAQARKSSMKPGRKPSGGEITSENADVSSDKEGERPSRRKSKGSCLKLI